MKTKDLNIGEIIFTYNDKILEHKIVERQTLEEDLLDNLK